MNAKTVVFSIAIAAAACGPVFAEQPQTRVKLATLAPRGSSIHQILQAMGEKWRDAPGGGAALTIYTDGTMGGEAEAVRRMRVNQVQAGMLSVAGLAQIDRAVTALQYMPMVFRSTGEVEFVRRRLRPMLDKRLEEKGCVALFWADAGWVRFFSKKRVIHPDDLKKLKMFALASDVNQIDLMKSAGFQPVPLEYTDTLTGLQTGLIESVPTIPFYALAGQLYLPAPYMLEINYAPLNGALVIARKSWEALPPITRAAMRQAAEEAGDKIQEQSRKEMHESVIAMQKRGLKVDSLTPEVEAEWRTVFEGVYPKLRGNLVPAEMYDEVQRLLTEYRK